MSLSRTRSPDVLAWMVSFTAPAARTASTTFTSTHHQTLHVACGFIGVPAAHLIGASAHAPTRMIGINQSLSETSVSP